MRYSFLVAPISYERNVLLVDLRVVDDRQIGGTWAPSAGRERDRDSATIGRRKRTRTSVARHVVAVVGASGGDTGDIQHGCAGVGEGHVLGEAVADLYGS